MTIALAKIDGRTLRRERNVSLVLDAVQQLLVEGHANPAPELVAARAGVSLRSLYRYFPDREQLVMASLAQQVGAAEMVFYIDRVGQGSHADRIERFVQHRLAVHDVLGPTARVAIVMAHEMPALAEAVRERQAQLRSLVAEHFAPDLGHLERAEREDRVEAVNVLCQFDSVETMRLSRGLTIERVREVLTLGVAALLGPAGVASAS